MRLRSLLAALSALSAILLLAAMFVAVHRGARGRQVAEQIGLMNAQLEAAEAQRAELGQKIEYLRSRSRMVRVASQLGLHLPSEEELVILDLRTAAQSRAGGAP